MTNLQITGIQNIGSKVKINNWNGREVVGLVNMVFTNGTIEVVTLDNTESFIGVELWEVEVLELNILEDSLVKIIQDGLEAIEVQMDKIRKESKTEYYFDEMVEALVEPLQNKLEAFVNNILS